MTSTIQILVLLLAVVATVAIIADRLKIPPSIPLVITGVLLALVPGLPPVELAPEIVLLLVLPPIIYTSAFQMSWREFRFNLRPIGLLSIGGVVFTTLAVAAAAHWLMDLPWSVGFVLGAIISPPDAIAPLSIARRMEIPAPHPRRARRRGAGQRCDRTHPLSLCRRRRESRGLLLR